ncbi:hypothetical protein EV426DRAFT_589665 [Tirmania nivea]|nr:hypothetical protein EV426DRAFT_589665 [Tirmania nivea]
MKLCQPLLVFASAALVLLVSYSMDLYIVLEKTPYKLNGMLEEMSHQPNDTFSNSALITGPPPITYWCRCPYF